MVSFNVYALSKSAVFSFTKKSVSVITTLSLVLGSFALVLPSTAAALDSGFVAPNQTIAANISSPDNGWASDNNRVSFSNSGHKATYGFPDLGIPGDAIINGIIVTVEGQSTDDRNLAVRIWNQNTATYTNTAEANVPHSSNDSTITLGSSSDQWGKLWTASDFSDAAFKLEVDGTGGSGTAKLDQVKVKVDYTVDTCGAVITYTDKDHDFNDARVNINFIDGDHHDHGNDKVSVTAGAGYVVTQVWLDADDDGFNGYHQYASGPVTNFDPTQGKEIYKVKVLVKKTCPENTLPLCSDQIDNDLDTMIDLSDPDCVQFKPVLVVEKRIINDNGGTGATSTFSFVVNNVTHNFPTDGIVTVNDLPAATYSVAETPTPDYNASYSGDCDSNGSVTLEVGQTKTCIITNNDIYVAPPEYSCSADTSTYTAAVSDTTTMEGDEAAVLVTNGPIPPWTTAISGASWIWGEDPITVDNQIAGSTETFTKSFTIVGTPLGATLDIAADNTYTVSVNGHTPIVSTPDLDQFSAPDTYSISADDLVSGLNTITFTVTNAPYEGSNPAGLLYKLTLNKNACIPAPTSSTVTMCKFDQNQQPLSGWTLTLKGASVDNVVVDSAIMAGINTVANMTSGVSYIATAVGTWLNQGGANPVDAEYSTTDGWTTQMDGYTGYQTDILELQINNTFDPNSNWGAYNASHTYAQSFMGMGAQANFRIFDGGGIGATSTDPNPSWYGDNQGTLAVDVSKGYAGITGANGCVTFSNVPVGSYTVGEVMQDGWHNVSGLGSVTVAGPTDTFNVVNSNALACNVDATKSITSRTATQVDSHNAFVLTFNHASWTDETLIDPLAKWIWDEDGMSTPVGTTTKVFTDTFTVVGTPLGDASLTLAADNTYSVKVNGVAVPACASGAEDNYSSTDTCTVPNAMMQNGANTIEFTVTNIPLSSNPENATAQTNPAGLLYKLIYTENECVVPPPPVQCVANQELISNGSFEDPVVTANSNTWQLYPNATPSLAWTVGYVSGNIDPLLEIQRGYSGWTASQGAQWAELDSNEPSTIYQDIVTIPGKTYTFSFDFAARPDASALADNAMSVTWGGVLVVATSTNLVSAGPNNAWIHNTYSVVATTTTTRVQFTDAGTANSLGGFVDNVSLQCVPVMPPSTDVDLSVTKVVDDNTPDVGQTITYTINVANNSATNAAANVSVSDLLPAGLTFVSTSTSDVVGVYNSGTGVWTVGTLPLNLATTLHITATVNAGTAGQTIVNAATVSADNTDPTPGNNVGIASVTVNTPSDGDQPKGTLTIVKNTIGGDGTFHFTVYQEGPLTSTDVTTSGESHTGTSADIPLSPGYYNVTETVPEGWTLSSHSCEYDGDSEGVAIQNGETISVHADDHIICTFTNSLNGGDGDDNEGGGDNTPPTPEVHTFGANGPVWGNGGQVLGASTSLPELPNGCVALLDTYMREGKRNDSDDVKDLQNFLNGEMGTNLPISGFFGPMTDAAVKAFQVKYADQVLTPWGLTAPTGFVYRTTQRWINLLHCKDLNIPMPTDLTPYHNEDQ